MPKTMEKPPFAKRGIFRHNRWSKFFDFVSVYFNFGQIFEKMVRFLKKWSDFLIFGQIGMPTMINHDKLLGK